MEVFLPASRVDPLSSSTVGRASDSQIRILCCSVEFSLHCNSHSCM